MKKLIVFLIVLLPLVAMGANVNHRTVWSNEYDSIRVQIFPNMTPAADSVSTNIVPSKKNYDTNFVLSDAINYQFKALYYKAPDTIPATWYVFANASAIRDSLNAILDSLQNVNSALRVDTNTVWSTVQRDSLLGFAADNNTLVKNRLLRMRDSIDVILDTLQSQDGWIATATNLTKVIDTVNGIMDTLQNQDNWIARADSVNAILDSLQLSDTRLDSLLAAASTAAIRAKVWNADTASYLTAGTMGRLLSLAGDTLIYATIADVADGVWDEDSTGHYTSPNMAFVAAQGSGGTATVDTAAIARSVWDADVVAEANRTITIPNDGITSDKIATNAAAEIADAAADSVWDATVTPVASRTVTVTTNSDKTGYTVSTVNDKTGYALSASQTFATTGAVGSVTGAVGSVTGGVTVTTNNDKTGYTVSAMGNDVIGAAQIAADAIGASEIAATGSSEIADYVWDEDSTGHYTSPKMGFVAAQTAATSLTASIIADAVWDEDSVGHGATNKMGYLAAQTAASSLTVGAIIDSLKKMPRGDTVINTWVSYLVSTLQRMPDTLHLMHVETDNLNGFNPTSGVIVTTNNDKTGYSLSSSQTFSTSGSVASVTGAVGSVAGAVGSVTGAVGSVTGNVGGNVTGSVASVTGNVGGNVVGNVNGNVLGTVILAPSGLDNDTSFTQVQVQINKWKDSIDGKITSAGSVAAISDADMKAIADSVFNKAKGDTASGGAISYIVANVGTGGSGGGSGDYSVKINVTDSSGTDTVLYLAKVSVNNVAQSGVPLVLHTDTYGNCIFNLDTGSYAVIVKKAAYAEIIDTITVTGAGTKTIYTYNSNGNKAVVFGTLYNPLGKPYSYARAYFQLVSVPAESSLFIGDTMVVERLVTDTADASGYFAIPVYANADLSDSSYYIVTFEDQYGRKLDKYSWNCYVDDSVYSIKYEDTKRWR